MKLCKRWKQSISMVGIYEDLGSWEDFFLIYKFFSKLTQGCALHAQKKCRVRYIGC
jgi:hypothetical protein